MKILKVIGLGIIASLLVLAAIGILMVIEVLKASAAMETLSKALGVIGICVVTVLAIAGVSRLISD